MGPKRFMWGGGRDYVGCRDGRGKGGLCGVRGGGKRGGGRGAAGLVCGVQNLL